MGQDKRTYLISDRMTLDQQDPCAREHGYLDPVFLLVKTYRQMRESCKCKADVLPFFMQLVRLKIVTFGRCVCSVMMDDSSPEKPSKKSSDSLARSARAGKSETSKEGTTPTEAAADSLSTAAAESAPSTPGRGPTKSDQAVPPPPPVCFVSPLYLLMVILLNTKEWCAATTSVCHRKASEFIPL